MIFYTKRFRQFYECIKYVSCGKAKLYYAQVVSGAVGEYKPAISKGGANSANDFRYSPTDNQYLCNMDTADMAAGTYKLKIVMDDSKIIELKVTLVPEKKEIRKNKLPQNE